MWLLNAALNFDVLLQAFEGGNGLGFYLAVNLHYQQRRNPDQGVHPVDEIPVLSCRRDY